MPLSPEASTSMASPRRPLRSRVRVMRTAEPNHGRGRRDDAWLDNKITASFVWLFQNLFYNRPRWRECSAAGKQKARVWRASMRALFRTRTGDPLLTMRSSRQLVATRRNGLACFRAFPAPNIYDRLPPVATTGLHKGSIFRCLRWLQQRRLWLERKLPRFPVSRVIWVRPAQRGNPTAHTES